MSLEPCEKCRMLWDTGIFGPGSCPRCADREKSQRAEEQWRDDKLRSDREIADRLLEAQDKRAEEDRLDQEDRDEKQRRDQDARDDAHRAFLEQQADEQEEWEAEREAERQRHVERVEADRRSHLESLAERQRRELHYQTLRQSRYGKARDDLDIALAQKAYDPSTAFTALCDSVEHWPGYAWAWLELAEMRVDHGQSPAHEIERACASALGEGVWKLAPENIPAELIAFVDALPGANAADLEGVPARQAWFLVRFSRVAPPGYLGRLLSGSPAFYPLLEGMPANMKDPDRDAPILQPSSIKQVDLLAFLFLASRSIEALERLVAYAEKNKEGRSSIARGHILSRWGSDATLFAWCKALASDPLASGWLRAALRARLVDPVGVLEKSFAATASLAREFDAAMARPLAGRVPAARAVLTKASGLKDASPPVWEKALNAAFTDRARVFDALSKALPPGLQSSRALLLERAGREADLKSSALADGHARHAAWQATLGRFHAAWKAAQLELIAATPVKSSPIAPPGGVYSDDAFLEWRRQIDAAIVACDLQRAEFGDPEVDRALLEHRLAGMRETLRSTRELIRVHLAKYEAEERIRIQARLEQSSVPARVAVSILLGLLVCAGPFFLAYWLHPEWLCASSLLSIPVAALVGRVLFRIKRRDSETDILRDVDAEARLFRSKIHARVATPIRDVALHLSMLGESVAPPVDASEPPATSAPQKERTPQAGGVAVALSMTLMVAVALVSKRATVTCPTGMVLVSDGAFPMGSPGGVGDDDEHPQHRVRVSAFCIDRTEVTVAAWRRCVTALACSEPGVDDPDHGVDALNWNHPDRDRHPINGVNWEQARAYCQWRGGRLPTEAEWEFAARGASGRMYPWGDSAPTAARANLCGSECEAWLRTHDESRSLSFVVPGWSDPFPTSSPVGSFPDGATPQGLMDMAGNAWEWTADWYTASYPSDSDAVDPRGPMAGTARVVRGGIGLIRQVNAAHRWSASPTDHSYLIGFRCAQTPR